MTSPSSSTELTPAAVVITAPIPTPEATSSSSSSASESETTTGVDADTEESVTSEDDEKSETPKVAVAEDGKKEKWVAVKSASTPDPAANTTATP